MANGETPDLTLIARQRVQITTELGSKRDDIAVLTAIRLAPGWHLGRAADGGASNALTAFSAGKSVRDLESQS